MKTIHILTLAALSCFSAPTFAADAAQMAQGQKIYETNCAACHGKKGEGRGAMFRLHHEKTAGTVEQHAQRHQRPDQG